ncbi:LEPR-XLL domain-containing protein [Streptomyces sp. NPDC088360]|uniref:LEPR-XLL domain-containing protein n=1 Tax=unclassified Streptomyces TaxID=2593676 RepID=UPI00344B888B
MGAGRRTAQPGRVRPRGRAGGAAGLRPRADPGGRRGACPLEDRVLLAGDGLLSAGVHRR